MVPLDASGFTASIIGFAFFAMATGVCALAHNQDWFLVFITGTGIGTILMAITAIHRFRRRRQETVREEPNQVLEESLVKQ